MNLKFNNMGKKNLNSNIRTDGSGILQNPVAPDDQTPTWSERKENSTGLAQLTYEYFERARLEDQDIRSRADYLEREVLGFPLWPHGIIRGFVITSFFIGIILLLSAALPPHIAAPANPSQTPAVILPDWYLYWSFGLLKLEPLNPTLNILGGDKLMLDRTYGVLANLVVVGFIARLPFINKGSARRPVEEPFWAAFGIAGVVFAFTVSALSIKNLVPLDSHLLFDLTFILPVLFGILTYSLLKTMREGYMYDLNRRYYRLRPPK